MLKEMIIYIKCHPLNFDIYNFLSLFYFSKLNCDVYIDFNFKYITRNICYFHYYFYSIQPSITKVQKNKIKNIKYKKNIYQINFLPI